MRPPPQPTIYTHATTTISTLFTVKTTATVTTSAISALPSSTSSTSSTAKNTPTNPLGGFDALEFADQSAWMFYTDQQNNIHHIQSWNGYTHGTWTPANSTIVSSGARAGSAVQAAIIMDRYSLKRSHVCEFLCNGITNILTYYR